MKFRLKRKQFANLAEELYKSGDYFKSLPEKVKSAVEREVKSRNKKDNELGSDGKINPKYKWGVHEEEESNKKIFNLLKNNGIDLQLDERPYLGLNDNESFTGKSGKLYKLRQHGNSNLLTLEERERLKNKKLTAEEILEGIKNVDESEYVRNQVRLEEERQEVRNRIEQEQKRRWTEAKDWYENNKSSHSHSTPTPSTPSVSPESVTSKADDTFFKRVKNIFKDSKKYLDNHPKLKTTGKWVGIGGSVVGGGILAGKGINSLMKKRREERDAVDAKNKILINY